MLELQCIHLWCFTIAPLRCYSTTHLRICFICRAFFRLTFTIQDIVPLKIANNYCDNNVFVPSKGDWWHVCTSDQSMWASCSKDWLTGEQQSHFILHKVINIKATMGKHVRQWMRKWYGWCLVVTKFYGGMENPNGLSQHIRWSC